MNGLLTAIILSACLGALVGLIRQWSDQSARSGEYDFGGVRTYTFWAMLGCLGAVLNDKTGPALPAVLFGVVALHQIVSMAKMPVTSPPGGTTFASVLLTMLVGVLVYWEQRQAALLVAATTVVILGIKQTLHAWTRALTPADIRGTMQFVAITGVILPLVPDKAFGPFLAFNPYSTWLMVVLISGLGFAGYVAMRMLGAKAGITITGIAGGVASSTATTLAFSRRSKEDPELSENYTLAVVLACTIMLARILAAIGMLNRSLAVQLIVPFVLMSLPGLAYAIWVWAFRRSEANSIDTPQLHNPLSLGMAIKFALIYAVVAFLVTAATKLDWRSGLLPISFLSGLTDMDAIALLMANHNQEGSVEMQIAVRGVILAAIGNSIMKGGLAFSLGSPQLRRHVVLVLGATALAGVGCLFLW